MARARLWLLWGALAACASNAEPAAPAATTITPAMGDRVPASGGHYVLANAEVRGIGRVDLEIEGQRIRAITPRSTAVTAALPRFDLEGHHVIPAFIDSHVHLAYAESTAPPRALVAAGVAGVVDLAAPLWFLERSFDPLRVAHAGPILTAPGGYPTEGWGAGGYGLSCEGRRSANAAVDRIADAGATVLKLALDHGPRLDASTLRTIVDHAHARGMTVVVHALGNDDARTAALLGADVLAHTPVEVLSDDTVAAWSGRAVISTLSAFGARPTTVDNLARLHAAGATVIYGTDLGNTRHDGIDVEELEALGTVGMSNAEILAAATRTPAELWGFDGLGTIEVGHRASLLVLDGDPWADVRLAARPMAVIIDGVMQGRD